MHQNVPHSIILSDDARYVKFSAFFAMFLFSLSLNANGRGYLRKLLLFQAQKAVMICIKLRISRSNVCK